MDQQILKEALQRIMIMKQEINLLEELISRYIIDSGVSDCSGVSGYPGHSDISESNKLYGKSFNVIPISMVRWAKIPGFRYHILSTDGRVINTGHTKGKKNHPLGRELKPIIKGHQEYVSLCRKGEKALQISISNLMIMTFRIAKPNVIEKKMVRGKKTEIRHEGNRMIVEKIDKSKPFSIDNLRFNFWWRGERHWNHKLNNELIEMIRSNLDMLIKDFMNEYGDRFEDCNVTLKTIQNVFKGNSWRVRTQPLSPMTHPEEDYPNGKLIDLIKENETNWVI